MSTSQNQSQPESVGLVRVNQRQSSSGESLSAAVRTIRNLSELVRDNRRQRETVTLNQLESIRTAQSQSALARVRGSLEPVKDNLRLSQSISQNQSKALALSEAVENSHSESAKVSRRQSESVRGSQRQPEAARVNQFQSMRPASVGVIQGGPDAVGGS